MKGVGNNEELREDRIRKGTVEEVMKGWWKRIKKGGEEVK